MSFLSALELTFWGEEGKSHSCLAEGLQSDIKEREVSLFSLKEGSQSDMGGKVLLRSEVVALTVSKPRDGGVVPRACRHRWIDHAAA